MKKSVIAIVAIALSLVLVLAGCGGNDYKKAESLYAEGKYAEAIEIYESLGDYEDSATKLKECKYAYADELMTEEKYEEAAELYGEIKGYNDAADKYAKAQSKIMLAKYGDTVALLEKDVWFFNGGADTILNSLKFVEGKAVISQITYSGNGASRSEGTNYAYTLDDANITITLADGSELGIAYAVDGETIKLGDKDYYTAKEVDEGLQGYWSHYSAPSYAGGIALGAGEYIYCYDNGEVIFEHASEAYGYNDGTYYYYGPDKGTYEITEKGLEVEAKNEWQFGFNIIDGEVVMVRCEDVCERTDGFKGEDGFKF